MNLLTLTLKLTALSFKITWSLLVITTKVIYYPTSWIIKGILRMIFGKSKKVDLKTPPKTFFEVENKIVDGKHVKVSPQEAGYRFEAFITHNVLSKRFDEVFDGAKVRDSDWYPENMRKVGNDHGIDQICVSDTDIKLVQCKYYSSPLKKEVVSTASMTLTVFTEYYRSIGINKRITMEIVTNSRLDGSATAYAESMGIFYTDGNSLNKILAELSPESLA